MVLENALGFLQDLVSQFGYLGVFAAALIANTTIFIPIPFELILFGLAASGQFNLPLLVVLSAFGAAIGELSSYFVGWGGKQIFERLGAKNSHKWHETVKNVETQGMALIVFVAFIPFVPFDLIALAAGYIRFNLSKFFIASVVGKLVRYSIVALAGFYGVQLVRLIWVGF